MRLAPVCRRYKLDAFLDWERGTYDLALDDVLLVEAAPLGFDGAAASGVSRVGLYVVAAPRAVFGSSSRPCPVEPRRDTLGRR